MIDKFRVSLCCPLPRTGFGSGDVHVEDEIAQLETYLTKAEGAIVVFPEGYLLTSHVKKAEQLAKKYNKWLIIGSEDDGEQKSLYTLVIDPDNGEIYKHCKTSLTDGDRRNKAKQGNEISAVGTPFGRIGTVLCYELHFPEVARIECLQGARILFNTIGTGMWHEQQLGCTHFCDPIPLMFGYDPHGKELLRLRNTEGLVNVDIDMSLIDERDYFKDRNPESYTEIARRQ